MGIEYESEEGCVGFNILNFDIREVENIAIYLTFSSNMRLTSMHADLLKGYSVIYH